MELGTAGLLTGRQSCAFSSAAPYEGGPLPHIALDMTPTLL